MKQIKQALWIIWFWRETYYYRKAEEFVAPSRISGYNLQERGLGVWRAKQAAEQAQLMGIPSGVRVVLFVEQKSGEVYYVLRGLDGEMIRDAAGPNQIFSSDCHVACLRKKIK